MRTSKIVSFPIGQSEIWEGMTTSIATFMVLGDTPVDEDLAKYLFENNVIKDTYITQPLMKDSTVSPTTIRASAEPNKDRFPEYWKFDYQKAMFSIEYNAETNTFSNLKSMEVSLSFVEDKFNEAVREIQAEKKQKERQEVISDFIYRASKLNEEDFANLIYNM